MLTPTDTTDEQNQRGEQTMPLPAEAQLVWASGQKTRTSRRARLILQAAVLLLWLTGLGTAIAAWQMAQTSRALADGYARHVRNDASTTALLTQSERNALLMNALLVAQTAISLVLAGVIYQRVGREWTQRQKQEAQLQEANARLQQQAETDGLTGLKNRRAFEDCLLREWAQATRYGHSLSLLMIDVDFFKRFNDTWGHLVGDDILRQTAFLLKAQARASDTVARYGGEEFAILLPHTAEGAALLTAERIRTAFASHPWQHAPLTVSIGVASVTPEMGDPTNLVQEADAALYWAKQRGRDRSIAASMAPDA